MRPDSTNETQNEETLAFPFPFADHTLECPVQYTQLRNSCPVARVSMPFGGDAYLLTRHEDIVKAFTDPRCDTIHASDGDIPRTQVTVTGIEEGSLFTMPEARHNKIRRLVTQAFTLKHANEIRPRVEAVTNELIDAMERKGPPVDLFEDYAIQTPMTVICELLGVPRQDEALFRSWGNAFFSMTLTQDEKMARRQQVIDYIFPIIQKEREQPGKSVFGLLARAHEQGDEVLTEKEMFMFACGLIGAGFETVSTTFTNMAFIVLQRPHLLQQLKDRLDTPEQMALAIEELLRVTPIGAGGRSRITRESVAFSKVKVPRGEVLILSATPGNFDEAVFSQPDVVDFDRQSNPMLTFGRGIHACLGQQLARMELQVLWSTLLKRLPSVQLAVAPTEIPWRSDHIVMTGPAHLSITW
jgi:cytochrome P450